VLNDSNFISTLVFNPLSGIEIRGALNDSNSVSTLVFNNPLSAAIANIVLVTQTILAISSNPQHRQLTSRVVCPNRAQHQTVSQATHFLATYRNIVLVRENQHCMSLSVQLPINSHIFFRVTESMMDVTYTMSFVTHDPEYDNPSS
jgi:hypothetical protein